MKASTKQYARGLFEATAEAGKKELPAIIEQFIATLRRNNALAKVDGILEEFNKLWNEAHGVVEVEAITAQPIDSETEEQIVAYAKEVTGAEKIELVQRVSSEVVAGFILRVGDKVYDASAATKLKQLKRAIVG
jgi:F-type H+-transporting ATPase subunit delta